MSRLHFLITGDIGFLKYNKSSLFGFVGHVFIIPSLVKYSPQIKQVFTDKSKI